MFGSQGKRGHQRDSDSEPEAKRSQRILRIAECTTCSAGIRAVGKRAINDEGLRSIDICNLGNSAVQALHRAIASQRANERAVRIIIASTRVVLLAQAQHLVAGIGTATAMLVVQVVWMAVRICICTIEPQSREESESEKWKEPRRDATRRS